MICAKFKGNLYRYSNNDKLRKNCCFGDLVNSTFLYIIKRKMFDYDLVTKNREDLKEPEVIIINDPNEIKKALLQNIALYHWGRYWKTTNCKCVLVGLRCDIQ